MLHVKCQIRQRVLLPQRINIPAEVTLNPLLLAHQDSKYSCPFPVLEVVDVVIDVLNTAVYLYPGSKVLSRQIERLNHRF